MSLKAKFVTLVAAVMLLALAHAAAQSQQARPSQESLVAAWERVQREDPETAAFEKIAERRYRFKTNRFPFDGELRVLKATVDDSLGDYDYGYVRGVIEYDLVGLSEEVVKKYGHSYESWRESNTLYLDRDSGSWLSAAGQRARMAAKVKEATRSREEAEAKQERADQATTWLRIASLWLPVGALIIICVWFIKKSGVRRQRDYMNAAAVHMQNVEGLLERIAAAVEAGGKTKG